MTGFQPGGIFYTQGQGSYVENVEIPFISNRAPLSSDNIYPIGKRWIADGKAEYTLLSKSIDPTTVPPSLLANWAIIVNELNNTFLSISDPSNVLTFPTSLTSFPPGNVQFLAGAGMSIASGTNNITFTNIAAADQTLTGNDLVPVSPSLGTIKLLGEVVANYATTINTGPIQTISGGSNIENINIQLAASIASTSANNPGITSFDSGLFLTDSNGWTTGASGVFPSSNGKIMAGNSVTGYPNAVTPTSSTNISWDSPTAGSIRASLTGIVSVAHGGTGLNSVGTYGVTYGMAASPLGVTAAGAANTVLLGTGAAPVFGTVPIAALPGSGSFTLVPGTNIQFNGTPGNATLSLGGSVSIAAIVTGEITPVTLVGANYNSTNANYIIGVRTNSSSITITLQSDPNLGQTLIIKDYTGNASSNNITIDGGGINAMDLMSTLTINTNFGSYSIVCTLAGPPNFWSIIAKI